MRLLNVDSFELAEYPNVKTRPSYAILSHRWLSEQEEVTFAEIKERRSSSKRGYAKIETFAQYVKNGMPSVQWLWIDTCCINKDSAAELSEAVNLMFEWYCNAELCVAYLGDVEDAQDKPGFETSQWFTRGWTLQELLAPRTVLFVTQSWHVIGHKGHLTGNEALPQVGSNLNDLLARITGIPELVLRDYQAACELTTSEKLAAVDGGSRHHSARG
jgi:ankyrin repeat domain-containing protein 50